MVPYSCWRITRDVNNTEHDNQESEKSYVGSYVNEGLISDVCSLNHYMKNIVCLGVFNHVIGPAVRVFANGPGDLGSILGRVIPKTLKMELDTTLLNTQHYKVRFKGKVEQSWEWSSALPYTLV